MRPAGSPAANILAHNASGPGSIPARNDGPIAVLIFRENAPLRSRLGSEPLSAGPRFWLALLQFGYAAPQLVQFILRLRGGWRGEQAFHQVDRRERGRAYILQPVLHRILYFFVGI